MRSSKRSERKKTTVFVSGIAVVLWCHGGDGCSLVGDIVNMQFKLKQFAAQP